MGGWGFLLGPSPSPGKGGIEKRPWSIVKDTPQVGVCVL